MDTIEYSTSVASLSGRLHLLSDSYSSKSDVDLSSSDIGFWKGGLTGRKFFFGD